MDFGELKTTYWTAAAITSIATSVTIDQLAQMLTSSVSLSFRGEQVARQRKAAESYATRV